MATVQDHARTTSTARYEAFVEQQLARARSRIRLLDVTAAVLGLVLGTLAFGLAMILLDDWLVLSPLARQLALGGYVVAAVAYLSFWLVRPLFRRVNPFYAAKQVEQTVPGSKNSLVNWLDLHNQDLPPAIRGALSGRAAKDLAQANLEQAISGRQVAWLIGGTGLIVAAAIVTLCILRPEQFFSLLNRAFAPFVEAPIASRTRLTLLQPADGDVTVPINQSVPFAVHVDGRIPNANDPDAVRLLFRYSPTESGYEERRLEAGDSPREWLTRVPSFQVKNGFWYKIAAGDTETPEYRVQVRSSPLLTDFEVTYHYRPYLCSPDETTRNPNLEALRGTEVTLLAHTNRNVAKGQLQIDGADEPIPGELDPAHPDALRFRFRMEQDGVYRIRFTSVEGEANSNPMPYHIKVQHDQPPRVELTSPGKDVTLPANGLLQLAGFAADDFGLTNLTLRLRLVKDQVPLKAKVYREGKSFKLVDGCYPRKLEYKDFVELNKLQREDGEALTLQPGMEVEYWLEATDNCDYPRANVGRSEPTYKVIIAKQEDDPTKSEEERKQAQQEQRNKQEQDRKQAEQEQKQHEAKQDQEQEKANQEAQDRLDKQNPEQAEKNRKEQEQKQKEIEDKLKKALEDEQRKQDKEGPRGQAKQDQDPQPRGQNKDKGRPEDKGEAKQQPEQGQPQGQEAGQRKEEGKPAQRPEDRASGKPQEQPGQRPDNGDGKPEPKPEQQPGQGKNEGQPQPRPEQGGNDGQGKPQPKPGAEQQPAADKGQGQPQPKDGQGNDKKGEPAEARGAGAAKNEQPAQPRGEDKPGGKEGANAHQGKPKHGGADSKNAGSGKNAPPQGGDPGGNIAKGQGAPGADKDPGRHPVAGNAGNGGGGRQSPPRAEDVKSFLDALKSQDPKTRERARQLLKEMARQQPAGDQQPQPPTAEEREKLRQLVNGLDAKEKEELARALQELNKQGGPNKRQQPSAEEMEALRRQAKSDDPKVRERAKLKLEELEKQDAPPPPGKELTPEDVEGLRDKLNQLDEQKRRELGDIVKKPPQPPTPEDAPPGKPADPRFNQKPGELLLKTFREQVTRDMLDKAGIDEKTFKEFLQAREKKLQEPAEPLAGPQKGGALPNAAPNRVTSGADKSDPVQSAGQALPPPEYRKAYKEFTEELSRLKRNKNK